MRARTTLSVAPANALLPRESKSQVTLRYSCVPMRRTTIGPNPVHPHPNAPACGRVGRAFSAPPSVVVTHARERECARILCSGEEAPPESTQSNPTHLC